MRYKKQAMVGTIAARKRSVQRGDKKYGEDDEHSHRIYDRFIGFSGVLSIVFRKNASGKMKICAGKPSEGAAKAHLVTLQHLCYFSVAHANSPVVRYFIHRYRLVPHSFPDTYRNLAQTSISADLPSGKVPTTRVRLR